jgi:hypothetical protein
VNAAGITAVLPYGSTIRPRPEAAATVFLFVEAGICGWLRRNGNRKRTNRAVWCTNGRGPARIASGALTFLAAYLRFPAAPAGSQRGQLDEYCLCDRGPPTAALLLPTYEYIKLAKKQDSDGVVTLDSARYGEFQTPPWPCDHSDMIGHNLDPLFPPVVPHLAKFDAIIARLGR